MTKKGYLVSRIERWIPLSLSIIEQLLLREVKNSHMEKEISINKYLFISCSKSEIENC